MKPIVFVGYKSDMGALEEVCDLRGFEIKGMLDGNFIHLTEIEHIPILGSENDLTGSLKHLLDECVFFVSSGFAGVRDADDPENSGDLLRIRRIELLESLGAEFVTLIHPTAVVHKRAQIGAGSYIGVCACVGSDTIIGRHAFIQHAASVTHHNVVGKNFLTGPRAIVGGHATIGDNVYMGTHSCIIGGKWKTTITVGNNSMIHMGVICMIDVPDNTTVGFHGKMFKRYESPPLPDIISTNFSRLK